MSTMLQLFQQLKMCLTANKLCKYYCNHY